MERERKAKPRSAPRGDFGKPRVTRGDFARPRPARGGFDKGAPRPARSEFDKGAPRPTSRFRPEVRSEDRAPYGDPYKPVRRPPRERDEGGRGFTVNLDPDVARVFRGDASVNKALRLVMQLMQVVQGPPRERVARGDDRGADRDGDRPARRGYEGSAEARGFERKPRFEQDEDDGTES